MNAINTAELGQYIKHYLDQADQGQADQGQAIFITRGGKIYKLVRFEEGE